MSHKICIELKDDIVEDDDDSRFIFKRLWTFVNSKKDKKSKTQELKGVYLYIYIYIYMCMRAF